MRSKRRAPNGHRWFPLLYVSIECTEVVSNKRKMHLYAIQLNHLLIWRYR